MIKKRYLVKAIVGCVNDLYILLYKVFVDERIYRNHLWLSKYSFPDVNKGDTIEFTAEKSYYFSRKITKEGEKMVRKNDLKFIKNVRVVKEDDT